MHSFAPRVTGKTDFTALNEVFTIENGEPIRVYGYVISNDASNTIDILGVTVKNGSTTIATHNITGKGLSVMDILFRPDAGLSFELTLIDEAAVAADLSITVFHSTSGV